LNASALSDLITLRVDVGDYQRGVIARRIARDHYLPGNGRSEDSRYDRRMRGSIRPFGDLLREWRERRRVSQLALAADAEISAKHLSFLETGRSSPSREMVLRLSRVLAVPLRERNGLLHAAGFAPAFPERPLGDPALAQARRAVEVVLRGHEPYPALAVDRRWTLVAFNDAVPPLLSGADPELTTPPVNVLRLSLHPKGLGPRVHNFEEWRAHIIERLRREIDATADAHLTELLRELLGYPTPPSRGQRTHGGDYASVAVPLELETEAGVLRLISTTTVFGTPVDVTLSELALEAFYPADERTAQMLGEAAARRRAQQPAA
jgi:transcriptional regulator with XRE-family HTH domain